MIAAIRMGHLVQAGRLGRPHSLAVLAAGLLASTLAAAALPLADASKDDLINRLSAPEPGAAAGDGPVTRGLTSKGFRPTEVPVRPTGSTVAKPAADFRCVKPSTRSLVVVEYADNAAAQVDMALQFKLGSHELLPAGKELLDKLAEALDDPRLAKERFVVAGHTDVSGTLDTNLRLSCARALSAVSYLTEVRKVDPSRLVAYGFGPSRLLADQAPDSPAHRRVEVRRAPRP